MFQMLQSNPEVFQLLILVEGRMRKAYVLFVLYSSSYVNIYRDMSTACYSEQGVEKRIILRICGNGKAVTVAVYCAKTVCQHC